MYANGDSLTYERQKASSIDRKGQCKNLPEFNDKVENFARSHFFNGQPRTRWKISPLGARTF